MWVTGITLNSRNVCPGDLYVGLAGSTTHGGLYAHLAAEAGAVGILTDDEGASLAVDTGLPIATVADPRTVMGSVAAQIYGFPSRKLRTFGVTGTNGKTTVVYLMAAALRAAGVRVGTIGTIGARIDDEPLEMSRTTVTTPESPDLQAVLAVMAERRVEAVVMEVSSHALALHRVDGVRFDVTGFTNLGWDHRDFHPTQEDYFEAKARLFSPSRTQSAVVAIDDEWGRRLSDRAEADGVEVRTTGSADSHADYALSSATPLADGGQDLVVSTPSGLREFALSLPGQHNARNAVTTLALLDAGHVDLAAALPGLARVSVPGRMQRIDLGGEAPAVYVDFAHTPQAVDAALAAVGDRRTVAVLGCGGDRDQGKRGPIGAVAASRCDLVIVTDDNPRSEDPATIRQAVLDGAYAARDQARADALADDGSDGTPKAATCEIVDGGDRRAAIRLALSRAGAGDVVAILGKGHERGQEIGGTVTPFDDSTVVVEEWSDLQRARREGH